MINLCVPVLKRYDLLRELVASCQTSAVKIDNYYIIDNGLQTQMVLRALGEFDITIKLHTPKVPLGVAASWNWFIKNVPEERVIVNDDITFAPHSLGQLVASEADLIWAAGCGFSCFVLRDSCVEKIGLFDEEISPGYGYYEDDDYLQRIDGRGTRAASAHTTTVSADVVHFKSGTLRACTHEEVLDHHRKFLIAQANYAKKWALEEAFK